MISFSSWFYLLVSCLFLALLLAFHIASSLTSFSPVFFFHACSSCLHAFLRFLSTCVLTFLLSCTFPWRLFAWMLSNLFAYLVPSSPIVTSIFASFLTRFLPWFLAYGYLVFCFDAWLFGYLFPFMVATSCLLVSFYISLSPSKFPTN